MVFSAYPLFARVTLTVWTSEIWEDFWIMRLVRAVSVLCFRADTAPVTRSLPVMLAFDPEKGSDGQLCPVAEMGAGSVISPALRLFPWAKLVRATAAWISLQPWPSFLCGFRFCS